MVIGALVGFGVGFAIGLGAGDDGVFPDTSARYSGYFLGGIGAAAGALVGLAVGGP